MNPYYIVETRDGNTHEIIDVNRVMYLGTFARIHLGDHPDIYLRVAKLTDEEYKEEKETEEKI